MNKMELISAMAEAAKLNKKQSEAALNAALDAIAAALTTGDKVQISGFGAFEVKTREARVGRNPQSGEPMNIPASRVPSFKASKTLKDKVAQ